MKKRILVGLALILPLLSTISCGVPQEEYNKLSSDLAVAQTQIQSLQSGLSAKETELSTKESELATAQTEISSLEDDLSAKERELATAQTLIARLRSESSVLEEQYELVGETPAETAENIVKWYHETHIYSKYDFFVCSDMALDVWNMLKAQGIDALIQIGNIETPVEDITDADHAWVLAETHPGKYLALETTGGYAVWAEDNSLYYKGWSFDNPKEYKRYVELKYEYNIRVGIIEQLTNKAQETLEEYEREHDYYLELVDEFNVKYVGHPVSLEAFNFRDKMEAQLAMTKEIEGKFNQLTELIKEQTQKLENIVSEMKGLLS